VTLSYMEQEVALDVRDDGCGFDLARLCAAAAGSLPGTSGHDSYDSISSCARLSSHGDASGYGPVSHAIGSTTGLVGLSVGDGLRHAAASVAAPASVHEGGFGLVAMRQRVESLAGTLQVESEPGFGTGISACIPVAQAGS
jgi:signal transduction histidine kinase